MYQDLQPQQYCKNKKRSSKATREFDTLIHLHYESLFYMIQHLHIVIHLYNVKAA